VLVGNWDLRLARGEECAAGILTGNPGGARENVATATARAPFCSREERLSDTKTVKPIGVIVVLAVAIAAFAIVPKVKQLIERDDLIIVWVGFTPVERTGNPPKGRTLKDQVTVEIEASPERYKEYVLTSPYQRALAPSRKGQRILVQASQIYGESLDCRITRGATEVARDHKTGGALEVKCVYVFK